MWYTDSFVKYAMPILGVVPDTFCPLCAALGIKTPINKVSKNDGSGVFYSCADYRSKKHPNYAFDDSRPANTPPLSGEQADQLIKQNKSGVGGVISNVSYCPVCAQNKGEKTPVHQRTVRATGKKFWSCAKNTAANNYRGCSYSENKNGPPLSEDEVNALLENRNTTLNQSVQEQISKGVGGEKQHSHIFQLFLDKSVTETNPSKCPFGHGVLSLAKNNKSYYCPKCLRESDGKILVSRWTTSMDSPNFGIFEFGTGDSQQIIVGPDQSVSLKQNLQDTITAQTSLMDVYGGFSTFDMVQDSIAFAEAQSSPELDNGQGQIKCGSIQIMSPEERANIPIHSEAVLKGIRHRVSLIDRSISDYDSLEQYFGIDASQQTGLSQDGRVLLLMDRGIKDDEKCENAKNSPLYRFTEIGEFGHTPNPSQANAFELLGESEARHLVLCLPTGVGKTTIAEAAIADGKIRGQKAGLNRPLAVYVCPARALAAQISFDFTKSTENYQHPFVKAGWKTSMLRGIKRDTGEDQQISQQRIQDEVVGFKEKDELLPGEKSESWQSNLSGDPNDSDIIVITPEKLLRCLQNPGVNQWVTRINTFIFDEGHIIGETSRGPNIETENIEIYEKFKELKRHISSAARIVYMSATMQNAIELVAWQQNMTDTTQKMQGIDAGRQSKWALVWGEWKPVDHEIIYKITGDNEEDQEPDIGGDSLIDVLTGKPIEDTDDVDQTSDDYQIEKVNSAQDDAKYEMGVLSDIVSDVNMVINKNGLVVMRPTLLFVQVKSDGYNLQRRAENYFWQCKGCGRVMVAPKGVSGKPILPSAKSLCNGCGKEGGVGPWIIPFHNADVDQNEQQKIVDNFNNDYVHHPVLIATSTLAAGVNTGAYTVIIYNAQRGGLDVETSQIIQEMGRAGRQKFLSEFPDASPRIMVYLTKDREVYDKRRINAKAYLESKLNNHRRLTDSVLRAISVMGVKDAETCGQYVASTFGFYQAQVDQNNPLNTRRGLEHISRSYSPLTGIDYIQWKDSGRSKDFPTSVTCKHTNLVDITRNIHLSDTGEKKQIASLLGDPIDEYGNPMFVFVCQDLLLDSEGQTIPGIGGKPAVCGAMGYMQQMKDVYKPDVLLEYTDPGVSSEDLITMGLVDKEMFYTFPASELGTFASYYSGENMDSLEEKGIISYIPNVDSYQINPSFLQDFVMRSGASIEELVEMGILQPNTKDKISRNGVQFLYVKRSEDIVKDLVAAGFATIENGEYKITTLGRQIANSGMSAADAVELITNMQAVNFNVNATNQLEFSFALANLSRFDDEQEENAYLSQKQEIACRGIADQLGVAISPKIKQIQSLYYILSGIHPTMKDENDEPIIPKCMHRSYYDTLSYFGDDKFLIGFGILSAKAGWFTDAPEELEAFKVQVTKTDRRNVVPKHLTPLVAIKGIGVYTATVLEACGMSNIPDLLAVDPRDLANSLANYYKERDEKSGKRHDYVSEAKAWIKLAREAADGTQVTKSREFKKASNREKMAYLYSVRVLNYPDHINSMWERSKAIPNPVISPTELPEVTSQHGGWYKWAVDFVGN